MTDPTSVVTSFVSGLAAGDLETCRGLVHQDFVFSEAPSLPFGGDWTGPDGILAMISAVMRHYRLRLDTPVIAPAGDRVLVRVSGTMTARSTGREMPLDALDLYEVRDGLIARIDVYYKDAAAVAALLEPAGAR